MLKPNVITNPEYDAMLVLWEKYRLAYIGGRVFIDEYLQKFSNREGDTDFDIRRKISYCPAHAKSAVDEVKNSIYQRLSDITRTGGPASYIEAINGLNGGVDFKGNTMDSFIGIEVLPELLTMAKVGIFIDKLPQDEATSLRDARENRPYLYTYKTEDIRSWSYDKRNVLISVLLRDHVEQNDPETGLITGVEDEFRLLRLTQRGVEVDFYDKDGNIILGDSTVLRLPRIPFVILEITQSLMTDVADYQIALLNLASSDLNYSLRSNFPFYTEMYNPLVDTGYVRPAQAPANAETANAGQATEAQAAKIPQKNIGTSQGRLYPKGTERPGFIHPSSEPLLASMQKQEKLREEIKELIGLSLVNLRGKRASADSKEMDERGLEAGLSYIGLELEYGERQITESWNAYEGHKTPTTIKYPKKYSLKSDADRLVEANSKIKLLPVLPSAAYQKAVAKDIANIIIGSSISDEELQKIYSEIDSAKALIVDPAIVKQDHEAGFVSTKLASQLRGYPNGEVEQAKLDHAERLARIAASQSNGASRGLKDNSTDSAAEAAAEKANSRQTDEDDVVEDHTRGEGA